MCRSNPANPTDKISRIAWALLLVVTLALVTLIRLRLLDLPLERDEGEYAYAGQLLLKGIPPYQLAYNMKFPGTYAAYALIMLIFGQSAVGIHLGLLLVNLATIALVFSIGRRLINSTAGIAAASSYAILSTIRSVLGTAGHATHFVVLPILAGALLLLRTALSKKILFISGLLFGLGLLMKQPAVFFIPFGAGYLWFEDWRALRPWPQIVVRNALFLCGVGAPLAATCALLWWTGVFAEFWYWTLTYAQVYVGIASASEGISTFFEQIHVVIDSAWPLWILAAFGLIACCWNSHAHGRRVFVLGLLGSSAVAVCPGLYFREHYFILVLPVVSLFAGITIAAFENFCSRIPGPLRFMPLLLFAAACALPLLAQQQFVIAPTPNLVCRMIYGSEPFPEAIQVGNYLQAHTNQDDKIAVLGSEPEIYFYADRLSATGYIYMYPLMEPHKYALPMQREMIQEIEAARPKYIVLVKDHFSWLQRETSEKLIYPWFRRYAFENLSLIGLVNIVSPERSDYYFPPPSNPESLPLSQTYLLIYERKPRPASPLFLKTQPF